MKVRPIYLLALITALAGVLRFVLIDRQPPDHSAAPIPPLLDLSYRSIARFGELTPLVMRSISVLAGTLTVPAVFFLVRQWFSARVALTAALLAACSTVLLVTSREATTTAPLILTATLSFGFLLHWLRTDARWPWFAWVASSVGMLGFGAAAGLIVLALQPVLLVLRKRFVAIEPKGPGPAMASPRFWSAALLQEGRAMLLVAIGAIVPIVVLAGYVWGRRAAWPQLPSFHANDLAPLATQIVFGFRWTPDAAATSVMTLTVAATLAMFLQCAVAPLLRVPTRPVWSTLAALLVVINLTLFLARFVIHDRPPVHFLARDTAEAQDGGAIAVFSNAPTLRLPKYDAAAVATFTHLKRVMLWEVAPGQDVGLATGAPGPDWRLHRDNLYAVYDPWTWRRISTWRRREFVRIGPLPEPAEAAPTTRPSRFRSAVTQPGPV